MVCFALVEILRTCMANSRYSSDKIFILVIKPSSSVNGYWLETGLPFPFNEAMLKSSFKKAKRHIRPIGADLVSPSDEPMLKANW